MRYLGLIAGLLLTGCAASDMTATERDEAENPSAIWRFDEQSASIRATSCPDGIEERVAQPLRINAKDLAPAATASQPAYLSGVTLAGAWHLTADNDEFGGLSGMSVLPSGDLLAISDDGKFIEIGLDNQNAAPNGTGSLAYLRDTNGKIFPNKRAADAEGLAYRDGIALVSFEQTHRINAYAPGDCGTAAHAVEVVKLDKVVGGSVLRNNGGAEALALSDQSLFVGFETYQSSGSPAGLVRQDGTLTGFRRTVQPRAYVLTGTDIVDDLTAKVFRAYDPARGPRAIVRVLKDDEKIAEAQLKPPLPVDNFEAIAIGQNAEGGTRLWLLSDDNFNTEQRTLLLALDLEQGS